MPRPISVLICTYNSGDFLHYALSSLSSQSLAKEKFEVVIIDDGSTDDTKEVINQYENVLNIGVKHNQTNLGLVRSCNIGIKMARGEYLIRLDADDRFLPGALEKFFRAVLEKDSDFVYSDYYIVDFYNKEKALVRIRPFDIYKLLAIGVLLRRSIIEQIGGYKKVFWEEYDLFIRFLDFSKKAPFYINAPLFEYYRHRKNMTLDVKKTQDGWRELINTWGSEKLKKYGRLPELEIHGV